MTLEKLEMIATALVDPELKLQWQRWWNALPLVCAGIRIPKAPVSDNQLLQWTCFPRDLLSKGLGESEEEMEIRASLPCRSHADVAAPFRPHIS